MPFLADANVPFPSQPAHTSMTIGVIVPLLSGFYLGEITSSLRLIAQQKGVNLVLIRTGGFDDYQLPLAFDHLDGLLTILDSASPALLECAIERGIKVMSLGESYPTLEVETIRSDQQQGVEAVFDHLVRQGHQKIGFCGNLSVEDIQVRFKAYQSRFEHWQMPYQAHWFFSISESTLPGGRDAGRQFIARNSECTAIICATDYNAVGFIEQLKTVNIAVPAQLAVASIDNTLLGARFEPALTTINQQLDNLVERALDRLIERIKGAPYSSGDIVMPQQLIVRDSCGAPESKKCASANLSYVRQQLLDDLAHRPEEIHESFFNLAQHGFHSLLNLPSVYNTSLKWAFFALNYRDYDQDKLYVTQACAMGEEEQRCKDITQHAFLPSQYPPAELYNYHLPDAFLITLIPIPQESNGLCGVVAVVDDLYSDSSASGYSMFNNYLDMLSLFIERDALIESVKLREEKSQNMATKIRHLAYYDTLTGIPNRIMMKEQLDRHIQQRPRVPHAAMLMDLDRFKFVNDTYGHDVGDALLQHVSAALRRVIRRNDKLARLGGDEFLFFCDVSTNEAALMLANRILQEVETPFVFNGLELATQGSIGIAFYPHDGATADDLIKKADIAMYRAKRDSSVSAMLYDCSMDSDVQLQATLEQLLRQAIENEGLSVHFQPQYNPYTGKLYGVESLARWYSPALGHVSPTTFIAVAEESGLIYKLGELMTRKSVREHVRWSAMYPDEILKLSINVSPGQLVRPHFADDYIAAILEEGGNPNHIIIEITETAAITDLEHCVAILNKFIDVGFEIALDDFGTGYSSLSLLKQLPLKYVKIDRSFIMDIDTDQSSKDIVRSIVMMCHSFGYCTLAEGVETPAQIELVKELGCNLIQGYVYSRPLPAEELERLLRSEYHRH
ncbi:EAL domain-containing protein [Photobacterium swingsii]|uniref:EAL domain-containing protein n=1 Tax=Photobacterium swingsii TaxID=680026 RepID=UPI0040680D2A